MISRIIKNGYNGCLSVGDEGLGDQWQEADFSVTL